MLLHLDAIVRESPGTVSRHVSASGNCVLDFRLLSQISASNVNNIVEMQNG